MTTATLRIPARFNGPPASANGGYTAGRLAAHLPGADAVRVRLRQPPPLERDLEVRAGGDGAELLDGGALVAEAAAADLDLAVPPPPSAAEARAAGISRDRPHHPFPTCFGCGPARDPAEAVAALLGLVPGREDGVWATTWIPGPRLPAGGDGAIAPEIVWVALDCPSAQPVAPDGGPAHVLGTITGRLERPVRIGVEHVLMAWPLGRDGRKAHSGAAVIGPDGGVCARAQALWIALPA
jgi:hypothetical protein